MTEEKEPEEGQRWTAPEFISAKIKGPPVGARIGEEVVCRNCMKAAEEIAMRRDFADPISAEEAEAKEYTCTRCGQRIPTGA